MGWGEDWQNLGLAQRLKLTLQVLDRSSGGKCQAGLCGLQDDFPNGPVACS